MAPSELPKANDWDQYHQAYHNPSTPTKQRGNSARNYNCQKPQTQTVDDGWGPTENVSHRDPPLYAQNRSNAAATMQSEEMIQMRIRMGVLENELQHARKSKDEVLNSNTMVVRALASFIGQAQSQNQSPNQNQNQNHIPQSDSAIHRGRARDDYSRRDGQNGLEELRMEMKELRAMNLELRQKVESFSRGSQAQDKVQSVAPKAKGLGVSELVWKRIDPRRRQQPTSEDRRAHAISTAPEQYHDIHDASRQGPKIITAAEYLRTTAGDDGGDENSLSPASLSEPRTPVNSQKHWAPDDSRVSLVGEKWKGDDVFGPELPANDVDVGLMGLDDMLESPAASPRSLSPAPSQGWALGFPSAESTSKSNVEFQEKVDLSKFAGFRQHPEPLVVRTGFEIDAEKVVRGREYDFEIELKKQKEKEDSRLLQREQLGSPPRMGGLRLGDRHVTRDYNRFPPSLPLNHSFKSSCNSSFSVPGTAFETPLDPIWRSVDEREGAIYIHKRAAQHEKRFPAFFHVGIRYFPVETDSNYTRGVIISDLPKDIELRDVLARVRGGGIVNSVLMDTQKLTGGMSVMVQFLTEGNAEQYVEYTTAHPISFSTFQEDDQKSREARVTLLPTPSFPFSKNLCRHIFQDRKTRCISIGNFPIQKLPLEQLIHDIACRNVHRADSFVDYSIDEEGTLTLEFASIEMADSSARILSSYKAYAGLAGVVFVEDPCARPLSDLLAPASPKNPLPRPRSCSYQAPARVPSFVSSSGEERDVKAIRDAAALTNECALLSNKHAKKPLTELFKKKEIQDPSFGDAALGGESWADEVNEAAALPLAPPTPKLSRSTHITHKSTLVTQEKIVHDTVGSNLGLNTKPQPDYGGFRRPPVGLTGSKYATATPTFTNNQPLPRVPRLRTQESSNLRNCVSAAEGILVDTSTGTAVEKTSNQDVLKAEFGVCGDGGKEKASEDVEKQKQSCANLDDISLSDSEPEANTAECKKRKRTDCEVEAVSAHSADAEVESCNSEPRSQILHITNPDEIPLDLSDDEDAASTPQAQPSVDDTGTAGSDHTNDPATSPRTEDEAVGNHAGAEVVPRDPEKVDELYVELDEDDTEGAIDTPPSLEKGEKDEGGVSGSEDKNSAAAVLSEEVQSKEATTANVEDKQSKATDETSLEAPNGGNSVSEDTDKLTNASEKEEEL